MKRKDEEYKYEIGQKVEFYTKNEGIVYFINGTIESRATLAGIPAYRILERKYMIGSIALESELDRGIPKLPKREFKLSLNNE